jgi:hypothetical protein
MLVFVGLIPTLKKSRTKASNEIISLRKAVKEAQIIATLTEEAIKGFTAL